jgi:hypothetical protein
MSSSLLATPTALSAEDAGKSHRLAHDRLTLHTPKPLFPPAQAAPSSDPSKSPTKSPSFDPDKHISFQPPKSVYTLDSLGYPDSITSAALSQVAITEPFPLFTPAAVTAFRRELFQPQVLKKCAWYPNPETCQLRGIAPKYAEFIYEAWMHPATQAAINAAAETELEVIMPYEIGHTNMQMGPEGRGNVANIVLDPENPKPLKLSHPDDHTDDLARPTVYWHHDSYPFVCVVSLSPAFKTQRGGETALKKYDGSVVKVASPGMGWAIILQGRLVEHVALRAFGFGERITMVTSFRPKKSTARDSSVLTTVRPVSKLGELYEQWFRYRADVLRRRCVKENLPNLSHGASSAAEVEKLQKWCKEQIAWLTGTLEEMVIYENRDTKHT